MNIKQIIAMIILTLIIAFMDITGYPSTLFVNVEFYDVTPVIISLMVNFLFMAVIAVLVFLFFGKGWKLGLGKEGLGIGL